MPSRCGRSAPHVWIHLRTASRRLLTAGPASGARNVTSCIHVVPPRCNGLNPTCPASVPLAPAAGPRLAAPPAAWTPCCWATGALCTPLTRGQRRSRDRRWVGDSNVGHRSGVENTQFLSPWLCMHVRPLYLHLFVLWATQARALLPALALAPCTVHPLAPSRASITPLSPCPLPITLGSLPRSPAARWRPQVNSTDPYPVT